MDIDASASAVAVPIPGERPQNMLRAIKANEAGELGSIGGPFGDRNDLLAEQYSGEPDERDDWRRRGTDAEQAVDDADQKSGAEG
jgi:hypothetical protein